MFDEIFIKQMSSVDAYNYGRQMMEKELNKLGECEYNKGRADAIEEFAKAFIEEGKKIKYLRHLWIESTCKKIAEQLKEQQK